MVSRYTQGFTLIELLAAFMMLAVVGTALLSLFQGGISNIRASDEYAHAAMLASAKLTELHAHPVLVPGEHTGQFDERYRWALVVSRFDPADGADPAVNPETGLGLLHGALSVHWGDERDPHEFRVATLFLARETTRR